MRDFNEACLRSRVHRVGFRGPVAGGPELLPALPYALRDDVAAFRGVGHQLVVSMYSISVAASWPIWRRRSGATKVALPTIEESCFADLRARGIDAFQWDLALEEAADRPPVRRDLLF